MGEPEAQKLQKHLSLLRHEYVKLQSKCMDLEQKLSLATVSSGDVNEDSYISQFLRISNDLYEKETYSDITVSFGTKSLRCHKLILAARSNIWTDKELRDIQDLNLEDISNEVGTTLLKWVYTDRADIQNDETFIMNLVKAANRYKLKSLRSRCEHMLMSSVSVSNCIRFYQTAEDIGADALRKYCGEIIANHWDDLKTEDFAGMSAPLLFDMFKAKSSFPLHFAVWHHREDIVFLYLIEQNLNVPAKLNEVEPKTNLLPLQIALMERQDSIAKTLVLHNCDVNAADMNGETLLHKFIKAGDDYAAAFLIENGADVKVSTKEKQETPLHLTASYKCDTSKSNMASRGNMSQVTKLLLDNGASANVVDCSGKTPLQMSVASDNDAVFDVLLANKDVDLESRDQDGNVVLWFAILSSQELLQDMSRKSYASKLIARGSNPDAVNPMTGDSLLHLSSTSCNESAGLFLIDHGAQLNHQNKLGETPLHLASKMGLLMLVEKLLKSGANPNEVTFENEILKTKESARLLEFKQNSEANRKRIITLEKSKAMKRVKEIQEARQIEEEEKLSKSTNSSQRSDEKPFVKDEAGNPFVDDADDDESSGNPFLSNDSAEMAGLIHGGTFFDEMEAATSAAMALTSSEMFGGRNTQTKGAASNSNQGIKTFAGRIDVNSIQSPTQVEKFVFDKLQISQLDIEASLNNDVIAECWNRTALHYAVLEKQENIVSAVINHAENASHSLSGGQILMLPDLNIADSAGQTPLLLALMSGQYSVAKLLADAGADVNAQDGQRTLLHWMIMRQDEDACLFLLDNGANVNIRSQEDMSPLQMSIHLQMSAVVEALCKNGADVNSCDDSDNTALWVALKSHQLDIAAILVKHGAEVDFWHTGVNNCLWTLLHRAIYELDEAIACFLIQNKCDITCPRRAGLEGASGTEGYDGLTPLHLACAASQDKVVQSLVEHNAPINVQDEKGRAPIHIAIKTKNPIVTHILLSLPDIDFKLKDKQGQTPFVIAMSCRDNEASAAILAREPSAAEQFDNKGRNYLHVAISKNDVDSVLFLISIEVYVNSYIQDGSHRTPLHLAVPTGSEIIVRHLLLAGADVNAMDKNRQTPLHCAAAEDKAAILSVLLQNGANPDLVDSNLNNALHICCQYGNMASTRVLLTESNINAEAYNGKGQNPLHVLASYSRDNSAAIFDLFRQTMPNYPFDALDADESTAIFTGYTNGAVGLCCALLKAGAKLGTMNKHSYSVFNAPVATRKLLFRLLDLLNAEPAWSDGPMCHACGEKFGLTNRKHHCRHCGRLLCSKCSQQQMPILKYELTKPVRVCNVCFDFLTSA